MAIPHRPMLHIGRCTLAATMDDRNEKVSDSVERDIQGAVKMGTDAARTAKTLGKAAAHAAAGDVAGAAAEVVKDPETLKKFSLSC